ncbi:FitA-like ribbon-helix-helix domain-containing protein [Flexivirga oryzae]|uniref:Plasmid stability protein n=1 Tax=Flexivirga oryzae TaxID=1794944 RepID=A0A839N7C3_9MICO|nr:plasmid stability protein [Flexivirga oryzae]
MSAITIRNLSGETHRALKARAAAHGRSTEAEVRAILDEATAGGERLGTLLASIGAESGGVDFPVERDRTPREPLDLT